MPRGTSRQVKPRPKHSKGKPEHARKTRQARLGGSRSHRLLVARTGPLPHLQPPCACPCNTQTFTQTMTTVETVPTQAPGQAIATGVVTFTPH